MPKKEKMIPCNIVTRVKVNNKWQVKETNSGNMPADLKNTKDKRFTPKKRGTISTYRKDGAFHVEDKTLGIKTTYIPKKSPTATPKPTKSTKSTNKTRSKTKKR